MNTVNTVCDFYYFSYNTRELCRIFDDGIKRHEEQNNKYCINLYIEKN